MDCLASGNARYVLVRRASQVETRGRVADTGQKGQTLSTERIYKKSLFLKNGKAWHRKAWGTITDWAPRAEWDFLGSTPLPHWNLDPRLGCLYVVVMSSRHHFHFATVIWICPPLILVKWVNTTIPWQDSRRKDWIFCSLITNPVKVVFVECAKYGTQMQCKQSLMYWPVIIYWYKLDIWPTDVKNTEYW